MKIIWQLMMMSVSVLGLTQVKAEANVSAKVEDSLNAIEAFNAIIPNGVHYGKTERQEACLVTTRAFLLNELVISITNLKTKSSVPYFLQKDSDFSSRPEEKTFTQMTKQVLDEATNSYTSSTIRISEREDDSIFVEISKKAVIDSSTNIEKLNCSLRY